MSIQRCCPEVPLFDRNLSVEAALFKALGDPARAVILATLARAGNEVCVCDFTSGLHLNQSTVSHHLKLLKEAELVTKRRSRPSCRRRFSHENTPQSCDT